MQIAVRDNRTIEVEITPNGNTKIITFSNQKDMLSFISFYIFILGEDLFSLIFSQHITAGTYLAYEIKNSDFEKYFH